MKDYEHEQHTRRWVIGIMTVASFIVSIKYPAAEALMIIGIVLFIATE